jgi:hypothetical protein
MNRLRHPYGLCFIVINKQYEHANNRYFDVSATHLLALSATGFGGVEAMPH